jgi:hypothetical protein
MNDDIYISWEDLKRVFQRKQRKIIGAALIGALLFLGYFLFQPPAYHSTATFKQSSSRGDAGFDLKKFARTMAGSGSEGSTTPLMLSRAVLTKTIEELGLQAVVKEQGFLAKKFDNVCTNLMAEIKRPPGEQSRFQFKHLYYAGEKARNLFLKFLTANDFEVLDHQRQKIAVGHLGEVVLMNDSAFTLVQTPNSLKIGALYPLTILPRRAVIDTVKRKITVKPLREDKNILAINFFDSDRRGSADFVNALMRKYEEFIMDENKDVISAQLKYLNHRQDELSAKLDIDIQDHVAILKKSLLEHGYMGIEEEMESILQPLQTYQGRLNEIEIEMGGLDKQLFQTDIVDVKSPVDLKLVQQFGQSLNDQIQQASLLLQTLEKDETLPTYSLIGEPFLPLMHSVEQAREAWKTGNGDQKPLYEERKLQLASHLQTFIDHLHSRQKSLQESATYIEKLESDFSGMSLSASRDLFQQYCRQLDDLHAQLKQVIFFRDHLHEPHFEISTLSNVLNDQVSQQLVQKSSELEGLLCDSINRSGREHQRLKETLTIQKRFLESHLSQTLDLGKIRIQLIKEKIGSLYGVMKSLLQNEKGVIENKIDALKTSMQELPELWHMDKRLKFKAGLTKGMMEGLTQIAESKNLSRHLYQVESKPLDPALPAYSPMPPRLVLKTLGGAVSLSALFYFFALIQAFVRGFPASLTTLRMMGGHTSGSFSQTAPVLFDQLSDQDLETQRKIASFLLERKDQTASVAFLGERGSEFCFNLAHLLVLRQQRILMIDCNFDRIVSPQDQPGLWQYLHHTIPDLPIRHEKNYDFLTAGGTTRHGIELLASPTFAQLLSHCKERYDFVFLLRQAPLSSQDALQVMQLTDLSVITTYEESQDTLRPYLQWCRQKENFCATFAQYPMVVE